MAEDDHLAYGDYHSRSESGGGESDRGMLADTFNRLRSTEGVTSLLGKLQGAVQDLGDDLVGRFSEVKLQAEHAAGAEHRYGSFAQPREGNEVKWFVDGCNYFWAVSEAIENSQQSIWIMDWWLSPELYLRRPPAYNEKYRLDRLLQAAAERGVKVNVIVYKEVEQALTLSSVYTKHALEALHPNIAVFRHPDHIPDAQTLHSSFLSSLKNFSLNSEYVSKLPEDAIKAIYGMNEDIILYWAHHEKLCLIDGNLAFMGGLDLCYGRWDTWQHSISDVHPENLEAIVFPGQDYNNARIMDFQNVSQPENNKLDRRKNSRMGWSDVSICLRGPVLADLEGHFVQRWNFIYSLKYDVRRDTRYRPLMLTSSTDQGPSVVRPGYSPNHSEQQVLQASHANEQYYPPPPSYAPPHQQQSGGDHYPSQSSDSTNRYGSQQQDAPYFPPPPGSREVDDADRGFDPGTSPDQHRYHSMVQLEDKGFAAADLVKGKLRHMYNDYSRGYLARTKPTHGDAACQLTRSAARWSNGSSLEHSIQNAYISAIRGSQHFIYIENQFFITATGSKQNPVKNQIGAAIVERVIRAARAGDKFKVFVNLPAVPGFAGDLRDESSLGTRAIMEFQYKSINRGGYSIMEEIAKAGFNPTDYIRFYNLRNYDRINNNPKLEQLEQETNVGYEAVRREADELMDPMGRRAQDATDQPASYETYQTWQKAAKKTFRGEGKWDSVSACYMLGGPDLRTIPWDGDPESEMDAFVSEELYIHTKVMIVDDRLVICGSANLNDRSQLGDHDSEIAMVIEDQETLDSYMGGRPWRASKFAATLRRQLFRKHLGLLPVQDMMHPNANFQPVGVPNKYDFGSPEDHLVQDPLAENFLSFWNSRARANTEAFRKIFHCVPDDGVRSWDDYRKFYEQYFHEADPEAQGKKERRPAKYLWGHVVKEEFAPGVEGVKEMKDLLATIKGTLVEMPLLFLDREDIAKIGLTLNAVTEPIYT